MGRVVALGCRAGRGVHVGCKDGRSILSYTVNSPPPRFGSVR